MIAKTMRFVGRLLVASIVIAGPAAAQVDRYDPNTGKYVTSDPFAESAPSTPSPYRLDPRTTSPAARSQAGLNGQLALPDVATSQAAPSNVPVPAAATPLVPLGDMAIFDGSGTSGPDPLALPDWWPQ